MAKQVVKKTTTVRKTNIKLKPKSRKEIDKQRSLQAKKQRRGPDGRFI